MDTYNYKGENFKLFTGPRGGNFIIINNKKYYVKINKEKTKSQETDIRKNSPKSTSRNKEARGNSIDDKISTWRSLSCNVPDVEHEGDIDYDMHCLEKIGPMKDVQVETEYSEDGEEIIYACINFKCKASDYDKFHEYCLGNI